MSVDRHIARIENLQREQSRHLQEAERGRDQIASEMEQLVLALAGQLGLLARPPREVMAALTQAATIGRAGPSPDAVRVKVFVSKNVGRAKKKLLIVASLTWYGKPPHHWHGWVDRGCIPDWRKAFGDRLVLVGEDPDPPPGVDVGASIDDRGGPEPARTIHATTETLSTTPNSANACAERSAPEPKLAEDAAPADLGRPTAQARSGSERVRVRVDLARATSPENRAILAAVGAAWGDAKGIWDAWVDAADLALLNSKFPGRVAVVTTVSARVAAVGNGRVLRAEHVAAPAASVDDAIGEMP